MTSFRELREYALKREGQEEARNKAVSGGVAYQAAMQMQNEKTTNTEELLGAVKEMADRVVRAVKKQWVQLVLHNNRFSTTQGLHCFQQQNQCILAVVSE